MSRPHGVVGIMGIGEFLAVVAIYHLEAFGSGDTRDGEGHAGEGEAWRRGNLEGLDEPWGGEATAGGGRGRYVPPNEPVARSKLVWRTATMEQQSPHGERGKVEGLGTIDEDSHRRGGMDEEDVGVANGSFFHQNNANTVESAHEPKGARTVAPASDNTAPLDSLLEKLRSGEAPARRRNVSARPHRYHVPPAPAPSQPSRIIPPPNNARPRFRRTTCRRRRYPWWRRRNVEYRCEYPTIDNLPLWDACYLTLAAVPSSNCLGTSSADDTKDVLPGYHDDDVFDESGSPDSTPHPSPLATSQLDATRTEGSPRIRCNYKVLLNTLKLPIPL
ncbi:hypothetical protein DFP72DRAFT_931866 [Ephemerocybe angulata]|uniref:Uncharacterized protein n=1 Tax=Ephemerocybe angulata TaxID=980116 RepID=A0A8H6HDA6_9AGAR|nr:hypothetical protein DFP72DRAFT_931866 [Tulosesus angulatus]